MSNPQKIKAEVVDITSYGRQVYKIVFKTERKFPRFKAGQFLHLTLDDFDPTTGFWPESRVFSISSCSEDRKEVSIVYSVKGVYTKKMEEALAVGTSVWLKAPYGEFIIANHIKENETAVLIAGGTGVSPFIPFLRQSRFSSQILLHYGIKNNDRVIFDEELKYALKNDTFRLVLYLEDMSGGVPFTGDVSVVNGRLSVFNILESINDKNNAVFFISGPPVMIELFQKQLAESGIAKERIIVDEWG